MSADEYRKHAYARAIFSELRRHLTERFVGPAASAKRLVCEDVFYADREIPEDAIFDVLDRLERLELEERARMMQFEMRRIERTAPKEKDPSRLPPPKRRGSRPSSAKTAPSRLSAPDSPHVPKGTD